VDLSILSPPLLKCDTGCARCWSNYSGFGLRNFRMRNALRDLLEIALAAASRCRMDRDLCFLISPLI